MRGCNGQLTQSGIWRIQHGAQQWSARDLSGVNTVAEIEGRATSWRRMTVTLMTMGFNGLNNRP
jgi:hypothetical protein